MKNFFLILLILNTFLGGMGCRKEANVLAVRMENDKYKKVVTCKDTLMFYMGKPYHIQKCTTKLIPLNTTPTNGITIGEVQSWVDGANNVWGNYCYHFLFNQSQDYTIVNSTLLNNQPTTDAEGLQHGIYGQTIALALNPNLDKIVVFFRGYGGSGWSGGPPGNFISMPNKANTNMWYEGFAHELGHYFNLPHTFTDTPCIKITGYLDTDGDFQGADRNLSTPDDNVPDTAPDPMDKCFPNGTQLCFGTNILINQIPFNPPWHNIMSYYGCNPWELTNGQLKVIGNSLKNPWRSNLVKYVFDPKCL